MSTPPSPSSGSPTSSSSRRAPPRKVIDPEHPPILTVDSLIYDHPVVVFSLSTNLFCQAAKQILTDMGARFLTVELDQMLDGDFIHYDDGTIATQAAGLAGAAGHPDSAMFAYTPPSPDIQMETVEDEPELGPEEHAQIAAAFIAENPEYAFTSSTATRLWTELSQMTGQFWLPAIFIDEVHVAGASGLHQLGLDRLTGMLQNAGALGE